MAEDFTLDDAVSEPVEQKTQVSGSKSRRYLSDKTQELSEQLSPLIRHKTVENTAENATAQVIEDDFKETPTVVSVAKSVPEGFEVERKSGKKKKKKKWNRILEWKEVSVEVGKGKKRKTILTDASGSARAGELTFIMGSSGAGKTTLLNVLTGRSQSKLKTSGSMTLNGSPMSAEEMKKMSAYVQQDDVFLASQTVSEVLNFAVKMTSPEILERGEREQMVESLLKTFGLKQCEHTKVGSVSEKGISRGEKKRLAFACEVLTDPPILFCDEPTTGLDSFMSHQVMTCLKKLASKGKIIVCTIHQPSTWVYKMADRLVLLCQGRVAFEGPTSRVNKFLERIGSPTPKFVSVSDHFICVLSRSAKENQEQYEKRIELILYRQKSSENLFNSETEASEIEDDPENERKERMRRSWKFQFFALMVRGFVQISRRKAYILTRLFLTVLVSWFLGMVYLRIPIHKDNLLAIKGVIFATLQMKNILYMMPSLIAFWEDYPVVVREYQSNMYSPSAYFMARSLTDSILHLIFPCIFFAIIYFMTGLPVTVVGVSTFLTMSIAMVMIITSLSHAVVSICGNVTVSLTVAPLISVPLMVFGGFLITVDAVPSYYKPLSYISWYLYAFEAIMIALFEDVGNIEGCKPPVNPLFDFECSTGLKLISDQDFKVDRFWWDFVVIAAILLFWKTLGLVAFTFRIRKLKP